MKIYLAGANTKQQMKLLKKYGNEFMLQTFYDIRRMKDDTIKYMFLSCNEFLLDSGAFTFMNSGKKVHWKAYVDEYIEFINRYDVKQFFELDLYTLSDVGIEKTIKMRRYIEHHTGKKSIPVFHACMGMEMYRELCREYNYIAIGASGITEECRWTRNKRLLKQMVKIANSYGTKVHGLGYTRLENINTLEIPFYSVDSTSWLSGARFGRVYSMQGNKMFFRDIKGIDSKEMGLDEKNLKLWIQKQKELKEKSI